MEPQKLAELMKDSIGYSFAIVNKEGNLHIGLHGDMDSIILGISQILIELSKDSGMPLEEIGDLLNMAVDSLQKKGGKAND